MMKNLIAIFFCVTQSLAASWYFDGTLATGSNSGTSWTNAWRTYAAIVWGSGGVSPGDTLYISGGTTSKTYTTAFNVGVNGTAGNVVTISIGQDAGHNGIAIFDGGDTNSALGMFINGGSYTRVTGLVGTNRNLWVVNMRTSDSNREAGIACYAGIPDNQVWEGMTLSNVNNGFYHTSGAEGIIIQSNTLRYVRADYGFRYTGFSTGSFTNAIYQNNDLLLSADMSGSDGGPDGLGGGGGTTFRFNSVIWTNGVVVPGQHPDGVQMLGNFNKVYGNYFANAHNSGVKFEPLSPETQWIDCWAFNNVVAANNASYLASGTYNGKGFELGSAGSMTNVSRIYVFNNTCVDLPGLAINGGTGTWTVQTNSFRIENNVFVNCGKNSLQAVAFGSTNAVFDANSISAGATGSAVVKRTASGTGGDYAVYTQTNAPASVQFASYSAGSTANNYRLLTNVSGQNRSQFFSTDISDATRSLWTVGAYEFTASPASPSSIVSGAISLSGSVRIQ